MEWVLNVKPQPLYPLERDRYPLYRRVGEPQGRCEGMRKISHSPEFYPRTVQPVASFYTD